MDETILVVDDSKTARDVVAVTLRRAGYKVLVAEDGPEALALTQTHQAACVVTDFNMPEMDGIELTRRLRASASYGRTPVLMLTTTRDVGTQDEGRKAGVNHWIVKPFYPTSLLEMVARLIEGTAPARASS